MHKMLGMAVWFVTAVACIYIGMTEFGFDLVAQVPMLQDPSYMKGLKYVVGASGLISLLMMFMRGSCYSNYNKCPQK